ncbi:hypothetical protein LCGC14_0571020 [marine sediment metagenome]|uniref:Uncharacterized protein n=1 Tax=marine sediment metagenome TaxID=412755 RepID=A0A0F9RP70_9ZZZZ
MIRQLDTSVGLVVGGILGWFHHKWYLWVVAFLTLILWGYMDHKEEVRE